MIQIIHGLSQPGAERALETMFVDRKRLFVDLLGWDVPIVDGRFEMDRFDGALARYFVACTEEGDHCGSLRLLPANQPHILDTLFSDLCAGVLPRGTDTYEITRLCLPSRLGAAERLRVRNRLITAMVDHALAERISTLTGVVQADFREQVLAMGWDCAPLGGARLIGRQMLGAFRLLIDGDTPARLRATNIYVDDDRSAAAAPLALTA